MKIRMGFVTNSSSSSFIITYKAMPEIDKETLEKYPYLSMVKEMLNSVFSGRDKITTIKELDEYFIDQYCWGKRNTLEKIFEDDSYYKEKYDDYKEKIENGFNIVFKEVDYNDESMEEFLNGLHDGKNILVESE